MRAFFLPMSLALVLLAVSCSQQQQSQMHPYDKTPFSTHGRLPENSTLSRPVSSGSSAAAGLQRQLNVPSNPPPYINASSAIVIDALTGRTLFAKNADQRRQVASTQKLMTALVVCDQGDLSDTLRIQPADTQVQPTKIYFRPGEIYTRQQLVAALLVKSGNDAAKALARDVGGSESRFVGMMNSKARSLGMYNSYFRNPHGLTESGQGSTARDMAKCAMAAYRNPFIRRCISTRALSFRYGSGRTTTLSNTNRLLKKYPWVTGMKTGTTDAAGRCLISSATNNGAHAIVVVLGCDSSNIWRDSENLLRWAIQG